MSDNKKALLCVMAILIVSAIFINKMVEQDDAKRDAECAALANIGRHRGETIVIYGDMPTWKLQCLFEGERN